LDVSITRGKVRPGRRLRSYRIAQEPRGNAAAAR
jgi:hypothetical protein